MSAPFPLDLNAARRFLETLAGREPVTFQTFSDKDELKVKRPGKKDYDPNAQIMHGTLEVDTDAVPLERLNAKSAGVYVMVNAGNLRGRTAKNVIRVRALFLDTDGAPYPDPLPLKPHLVVESSPGRWHVYWKVDGFELSDFSTLQEALAEHYGTDPSIKDLPRVMRLPGFYHRKGESVMVELLEAHDHPPYTPADIFATWPFLPERLESMRRAEAEKQARRSEVLARAEARRAARRTPGIVTPGTARAKALLQAHHDTVAAAGDGARHLTLQRSARALGGYVAGGVLEAHEVLDVLSAAAEVCGLPDGEAADVIRWGLVKGAEDPLELKEDSSKVTFGKRPNRPLSKRQRLAGWYS